MSTPKKTNIHAGGEEWRDMDHGRDFYRPEDHDDILREARSRIQAERMSTVRLRLVDRKGDPVARQRCRIEQVRNAFPFGDQLWGIDAMNRDGRGQSERAKAAKRLFAELYNSANNLCYWTERPRHDASKTEERQGEWLLENFAESVDWTISQGMIAKGHPLFWTVPKAVPEWIKRYDYETRLKFAEVRVRNIVARFKGRVKIWDAVNEPMWEPTFANINQREWPHIEKISAIADYVEKVLRWCREEDPNATYLINDYGMEEPEGKGAVHTGNDGSKVSAASQRRRYIELFQELERRGVPADGVGMQSHTGWVDHRQQWELYDEMAETGLPVHITEFWASTKELEKSGRYSPQVIQELVAEYVANYITCAYAHHNVEAFFAWGLIGAGVTFHGEYGGHDTLPLYNRMKELFHKEWMTRRETESDAEGIVEFRGFHGDYNCLVPLEGGNEKGLPFQVAKGSRNEWEITCL